MPDTPNPYPWQAPGAPSSSPYPWQNPYTPTPYTPPRPAPVTLPPYTRPYADLADQVTATPTPAPAPAPAPAPVTPADAYNGVSTLGLGGADSSPGPFGFDAYTGPTDMQYTGYATPGLDMNGMALSAIPGYDSYQAFQNKDYGQVAWHGLKDLIGMAAPPFGLAMSAWDLYQANPRSMYGADPNAPTMEEHMAAFDRGESAMTGFALGSPENPWQDLNGDGIDDNVAYTFRDGRFASVGTPEVDASALGAASPAAFDDVYVDDVYGGGAEDSWDDSYDWGSDGDGGGWY